MIFLSWPPECEDYRCATLRLLNTLFKIKVRFGDEVLPYALHNSYTMPSGAKDLVEYCFFPEATCSLYPTFKVLWPCFMLCHWTSPLGMISPRMIGGKELWRGSSKGLSFSGKEFYFWWLGVLSLEFQLPEHKGAFDMEQREVHPFRGEQVHLLFPWSFVFLTKLGHDFVTLVPISILWLQGE